MTTSKTIISGWILYLTSLLMPWSGRSFGDWSYGWLWQLLDIFPFIRLITLEQVGLLEIASTMAVIAGMIMWASPLLIVLMKRRVEGLYCYLPFTGFILALFASCFKLYYLGKNIPHPVVLYIFGNLLWILSYVMIWRGFIGQLQHIRDNSLRE